MKKIIVTITKFQQIIFLMLILFCAVNPLNAQNKFDMQQWTGAWGSDGLINTGDLNGDGKTDVFMWKDAIKTWTVNISNGTGFTMQAWPGWGTTNKVYTGFLNNDRKTDVFFWDEMGKVWRVNLSTGTGFEKTSWTGAWGSDGPIYVGDLNKDKKSDVFMWRDSDKSWMVNLSTGSGFTMQRWTGAWGSDGPINVADLNGDERDDVFMWKDSDKSWTINLSTGSGFDMQRWTGAWGSDGEIHIGHLNNDKKADVFMWRDSEGWQVNLSTGTGFINEKWVGACKQNYTSKTGDFNGDSKTDVGIWKEETKEWMINFSTGNGFKIETYTGAWGSDGPIFTGHLNNDVKTDIFMWRGSDNTWIINLSNPLLPGFVIGKTTVSDCVTGTNTNIPQLYDISPDSKNGVWISEINEKNRYTSGVILSLAGDQYGALYAVSQSAGIWKTQLNSSGEYEKWLQLENSPQYAYCIAVDPQFPDHIVVGEKEGEKSSVSENHCGLWESFDGGKTFDEKYYFDPLKNICQSCASCNQQECANCLQNKWQTQVITDVLITDKSTTLITTPCGLARREYLRNNFEILPFDDQFTSIASYQELIVAKSASKIYFSNNDGKNWKEFLIQYQFKESEFTPDDTRRAGLHSIAILRTMINENEKIFIYIPATRKNNSPNMSSILIFDLENESWTNQIFSPGLGLGAGSGCVFIKSFYINLTNFKNDIGEKSQLVFGNVQGFSKANKIMSDGKVEWQLFAESNIKDSREKRFHADVWDFHINTFGDNIFAVTDGGVHYRKLDPNNIGRLKSLKTSDYWMHLNEGLHTLNINSVAVHNYSPKQTGFIQINPPTTDKVTISTIHNDAWITNGVSENPSTIDNWRDIHCMGDANFSFTDWANGFLALNIRDFYNPTQCVGDLRNFGNYTPPGSKTGKVSLSQNIFTKPGHVTNGPQVFSLIQTLHNETVYEYLDAVMLVQLPLTYGANYQKVDGDLGVESWHGRTAIIRNKEYAKNPSIDNQNATGWKIEYSDLPDDAIALWVSGGHSNPTYLLFTGSKIYKRNSISDLQWQLLPDPPSNIVTISVWVGELQKDLNYYGPLFVNPFDPDIIFVACQDGIYRYDKASNQFILDETLTNFLTDNGKYDINISYSRRSGEHCMGENSNQNLGALSSMSFNPVNPKQIVSSSPFTGIFFKDGDKDWISLTNILPKPFTPITSTAITPNGIYVGTAGRGLLLIKNYINSTEINEKKTKKKIAPEGVYPDKTPQIENIENSKNCSRTISYWFDGPSNNWPDFNGTEPGNITIAGINYDEKTGRLIGNYSSPTNQYDVKHAFILLATLKLSQVNPDNTIWNYATACEKWLAGLRKITPDNIQVKNEKMIPIIRQIQDWINSNLCK